MMQTITLLSKPCEVCHESKANSWVFCKQPDDETPIKVLTWNGEEHEKIFIMHTCKDCREYIPYETIPVTTSLDKGYFFCPYLPSITNTPKLTEEKLESLKKVMTNYGKSVLSGSKNI